MKVLCVGQSAYDITLPMSGYPIENKKYKINHQIECGGGSSNNAAYLLSLWGNEVYLASSIGKDFYGEKIKEELKSVGVNIDYFEEIENVNTTTSYIINNTLNGSRTILTNKNPLMHFTNSKKIDLHPDVIFLDGNDYQMSLEVLKENKEAMKIIDAGSMKEGMQELCEMCDYVVCSNDFAKEFSHINFQYEDMNKIKEAYDILDQSFNGKVIITLESHGSFVKIDNDYYLIPSILVNSVDSTGAGDIYHGAFTHFIMHGYELKKAIYYSNIAGALSVTKIGSKNSMPKLEEVLSHHELW